MKLITAFTGLILLSTQVALAQEPICEWGPDQKREIEGTSTFKIIGADENGTCALITSRSGLSSAMEERQLICYDEHFKKKFSTRLFKNLKDAKDASTNGFNNVFFSKGKVFLVADGFRTQSKEAYFGVSEVDMETGDLGDLKVLDNMQGGKLFNHGDFYAVISDDKSKMLLYTVKPGEKDAPQAIRLKVFNTGDWKELCSEDITLPYSYKKNQEQKLFVDNAGGVYVYIKYKLEKNNFVHALFTYSIEGKKWEEHDLDFKGNTPSVIKFKFDPAQNLIVSGLLNKNKESDYAGDFYFVMDQKSKKLEKEKIVLFGEEVLKNWTSAGLEIRFKKKEGLDYHFVLKDLLPRTDGGLIQVLEYVDETHDSHPPVSGGMGIVTDYTYNTNDILILSLDVEGNLAWMRAIPKQQVFTSAEINDNKYGSFVYALEKNRLIIFWNNAKVNENYGSLVGLVHEEKHWVKWKGPDDKMHTRLEFSEKAVVPSFLYVVEPNGDLKYKNEYGLPLFHMFDKSNYETILCTNSFIPYNGNLYVWSEMPSGSRYKLGRIKL